MMPQAPGSSLTKRIGPERHVCLYQDSMEHYVSIQVAVLSLLEHEPDWHIDVYLTTQDSWLTAWLADIPAVRVHRAEPAQNGFNAKPLVILDCMKNTGAEVIWFDSDMLLTKPLSPFLDSVPATTCVIAENPPGDWPDGTEMRTRGWGFEVGRSFRETLNSCFVKFHPDHLELASAWVDAVQREDYVAFQRKHWSERPAYFLGDQDALNALIGSRRFAQVDVALLRCDRDIAQCFHANGYSWSRRIRDLHGLPPTIVHAQGEKPWIEGVDTPVYLDVSLYKLLARRYGPQLHERNWLLTRSKQGKLLEFLSGGNPSVAGLLPAMAEAGRGTAGRLLHPRRTRKLRGTEAIEPVYQSDPVKVASDRIGSTSSADVTRLDEPPTLKRAAL